jgi:hypothetical protein
MRKALRRKRHLKGLSDRGGPVRSNHQPGVISHLKQRFEANPIALMLLLLFSKTVGEVKPAAGKIEKEAGNVRCHHLKLYWI